MLSKLCLKVVLGVNVSEGQVRTSQIKTGLVKTV